MVDGRQINRDDIELALGFVRLRVRVGVSRGDEGDEFPFKIPKRLSRGL